MEELEIMLKEKIVARAADILNKIKPSDSELPQDYFITLLAIKYMGEIAVKEIEKLCKTMLADIGGTKH